MTCDKRLLRGELARDEGCTHRRVIGLDGHWRIGIGHKLRGNKFPPHVWAAIKLESPHLDNALLDDLTELSGATIDLIFDNDVADAMINLYRILPRLDGLSEMRKRALINFSFQCQYQDLIQIRQFWIAMNANRFEEAAVIMGAYLQQGNWNSARILRVARDVAVGE